MAGVSTSATTTTTPTSKPALKLDTTCAPRSSPPPPTTTALTTISPSSSYYATLYSPYNDPSPSSPSTPTPMNPPSANSLTMSHDLRADSIPKKRYKTHLFRYGYVRRSGKYARESFQENLANPRPPPHDLFGEPGKPSWGGYKRFTLKQHILESSRENWQWIGYHCSCCWLSPQTKLLNQESAQREIKHTVNSLKTHTSRGSNHNRTRWQVGDVWEVGVRGWLADGRWGDEGVLHECGLDEEEEEEEGVIWGAGEWGALVDGAVGRWEVKRRKGAEGEGWEVCSLVSEEWVDWEGVLGEEDADSDGDGKEEDGERSTVSGWTECGSEFL